MGSAQRAAIVAPRLDRPEQEGKPGPDRRRVPLIGGLARRCASIEGNALAACCGVGLAADPRVQQLAAWLIGWQWAALVVSLVARPRWGTSTGWPPVTVT